MIPAYLDDLRLDEVLAPYTSNVGEYIIPSDKDEYIVDSESQKVCGFVTPIFGQEEFESGKFFELKNPGKKDFALLQIDNAAIGTNLTCKCDCAILNDQFFFFIEFKANATSTKRTAVRKNYQKAMKQLKQTKDIIQGGLTPLGINLMEKRNVEAFVCFRKGYPRFTTSEAQYRMNFAIQTGGIPLSFDPVKEIC